MDYYGHIGSYGSGGYYFDFPATKDEAKAIIEELKLHTWLTRGTRAVFVDFAIYNANLNTICVIKYEHINYYFLLYICNKTIVI